MKRSSLTLLALLLCVAAPVSAQTLPAGLVDEVVATGLNLPVGMDFLPDGRMLVVEQFSAEVELIVGGTATTIATIQGVNPGYVDGGLTDVAVDPQWPARPYLYFIYDHISPNAIWITMYTVSGDLTNPTSTNLSLGAEYRILTFVPDTHPFHNGGALKFGPDGMLYVGMGDDNGFCIAQNPALLRGGILRLDVSGLPTAGTGPPGVTSLIPPSGNPFTGASANAQLVWAYGLRNPYRFEIDPVNGTLLIAEVGANTWEEINVCNGGENFGWPWREGPASYINCVGAQPPVTDPVVSLPHSEFPGMRSVVTFGYYQNQPGGIYNFGMAYENNLFYADYHAGFIRRLVDNGGTWSAPAPATSQPTPNDWGLGFLRVTDAQVGTDGAIYWLQRNTGSVHRVRPGMPQRQLQIASGNAQIGSAGQALGSPLVVQVTDTMGQPVSGASVSFLVTGGGGSLSTPIAFTDAQGLAQTDLTLDVMPGDPTITVTTPGALAATFTATWRGLTVDYTPQTSTLDLVLTHSAVNAPFTLAVEPQPAAPFVSTPYGDIWTSVLGPQVTAIAWLDGLGLLGPAVPLWTTGPSQPTWSLSLPGIPSLGGPTLVFQAYSVDAGLLPAPEAYLVTNPVTRTLN